MTDAWSLIQVASLEEKQTNWKPYLSLLLVNSGLESRWKKHFSATENIWVHCFASLSCPLACCAQLNTNTNYPFLSLEHLQPETSLHRTKKEMDSKQAVLEVARIILAWNLCACPLCCGSFFFFFQQASGSALYKKSCPSWVSAFPSAGGGWCHERFKAFSLCPVSPWFTTLL